MGAPFGLFTYPIRSRSHTRFGFSIWHVHRKRKMKMAAFIYICEWTCEAAKPSGKGGVSVPYII